MKRELTAKEKYELFLERQENQKRIRRDKRRALTFEIFLFLLIACSVIFFNRLKYTPFFHDFFGGSDAVFLVYDIVNISFAAILAIWLLKWASNSRRR